MRQDSQDACYEKGQAEKERFDLRGEFNTYVTASTIGL